MATNHISDIISLLLNYHRVLEELLGPLGLAVNQDMEEGKLGKVSVFLTIIMFTPSFAPDRKPP